MIRSDTGAVEVAVLGTQDFMGTVEREVFIDVEHIGASFTTAAQVDALIASLVSAKLLLGR